MAGGWSNPVGTSGSLSSTLSCTGPGCRVRAPVAAATSRAISNRQVAWVGGLIGQCGVRPGVAAEELVLVGGLVGAGVDQRPRPAGGDQHEWLVRMRRLQHGRKQVGRRCSRGGQHRHRRPGALGQAEPQEARRPLVQPHVQPEQSDPIRLERLVGQRRAARAGSQHQVGHPVADQLGDDHPGAQRGVACAVAIGQLSGPHQASLPELRDRRVGPVPLERGESTSTSRSRITPSTAQRLADQIARQQADGVQPAGKRQLGQRGSKGEPGPQADRGLQSARHHHRQPDPFGDLQAGPDAAQRLHLEDSDIGGPQVGHSQRVLGATNRLVGGDQDIQSRTGPAAAAARPVPRPCGTVAPRTPDRSGAAAGSRIAPGPPTSHRWRPPGSDRPAPARRGRPRPGPGHRRATRPARRP